MPLAAVRSGDLFFGARPSLLQLMCAISGERWRHVGLVLSLDDELYVVEGGHEGLQRRPLDQAVACYSRVGIARLGPDLAPAAADASRWVAARESGAYSFPWNVAAAVGWCSFARRRLSMSNQQILRTPFRTYASNLERDHKVATCSYLVLRAFHENGLDVLDGFDDVTGNLPASMAAMVTPEDVWRLPLVASRYSVVPGSTFLKRTLSRKKKRRSQVVA